MPTSPSAFSGKRVTTWLLPFLLAFGPAGCGGEWHVGFNSGHDRHHGHPHPDEHDKPDKPNDPQRETGIFLIAGDPCPTCTGSIDGTGSAARFDNPAGLTADEAGNLYVAEKDSSTIRKVTPQGVVTTLAGAKGEPGSVDGIGSAARLNAPTRITADRKGNLYVTDLGNKTIRKITPAGVVTTIAGSAGVCGSADGRGLAAQFCDPQGIAIDSAGYLYVADTGNHTIRMIDPGGMVTTIAGRAGVCGSADGREGETLLCRPQDVAVDKWGTLYVADTANSTVRKIDLNNTVSTLAGRPNECGSADGAGFAARLCANDGVAVDERGDLYVADSGNSTIRHITPGGTVSTVAGVPGLNRVVMGPLPGGFKAPMGVTVTDTGTLAVTSQNLVLKVVPHP